jgi:hypothetical protein
MTQRGVVAAGRKWPMAGLAKVVARCDGGRREVGMRSLASGGCGNELLCELEAERMHGRGYPQIAGSTCVLLTAVRG